MIRNAQDHWHGNLVEVDAGRMISVSNGKNGGYIFERPLLTSVSDALFEPDSWRGESRLLGSAGGRGTVVFVRSDQSEWAIRHYERGGMVGRWFDDHFVWLGAERTRSFAEWRLLRKLHDQSLPVPRPVAARYCRNKLSYTADLITERIPGAVSLSARLRESSVDRQHWVNIGKCIRRFHDTGVYHADLTGHNIMLDEDGHMHLLDFDRGGIRPDGKWKQSNLARLYRSLRKIDRTMEGVRIDKKNWQLLLSGYQQSDQSA